MIPIFRSDVQLFLVQSKDDSNQIIIWFSSGVDLTLYYSCLEDIVEFHSKYNELCAKHNTDHKQVKEYYDEYFYLPAINKHCSIGGMFFNNLLYAKESYSFANNLAEL